MNARIVTILEEPKFFVEFLVNRDCGVFDLNVRLANAKAIQLRMYSTPSLSVTTYLFNG
jgi:hypothetical protein